MTNSDLINAPEILGKISSSWTGQDFKVAIKRFRQNAAAAPIPRLYEAYRWLKEQIKIRDIESDKQFTNFIEHFLRILEERGACNSEIYSEVLRDSAEYRYLKELFHNSDETDNEPESVQISPELKLPVKKIETVTIKSVLRRKDPSLRDYDINAWHKLVNEHLRNFRDEESFIKNCSSLISGINKITEKEPYHIEIVIVYAFETMQLYKTPSLKTKDFAMKILNLATDRNELWSVIHKEYLELIKR